MSISDPRLFGHDPDAGIVEYFHFDEVDGGFVIETQQDVSAIIELNKARYNDTESSTRYGEWTEVANTPLTVIMDLAKQGIMTAGGHVLDQKRYKAWLNAPENQCFRVRRGRV